MTLFGEFSRRHFMTSVAVAAGSTLIPKALMAIPPQDPVVNTTQKDGKSVSREKVPWKVRPFPMKQVRLGEGSCRVAMEADRQYLHSLPPDRLLHTFRINAGLPSSAEPLGGWEAPDCELRGHYAGGHYLSACALMYASTGDEDLKNNANTVVAELGKCQDALKSGYLSAFPIEFFDRLRERQRVWAPFYTIHKIMAGLLDMYVSLRQRAGARDGRENGGMDRRLHRVAQLRAHAARARHGVWRHGRIALKSVCGHGQGVLPGSRAALRQEAVLRSAGRAPRRTEGTCTSIRIFRR